MFKYVSNGTLVANIVARIVPNYTVTLLVFSYMCEINIDGEGEEVNAWEIEQAIKKVMKLFEKDKFDLLQKKQRNGTLSFFVVPY